MTFQDFRSQFIDDCKAAGACAEEFRKLLSSDSKENTIKVIKENIHWCYRSGVLTTPKLLEGFTAEELNQFDIYTSGEHSIITRGTEVRSILTLGSSQATVKTWESSQATVETWESSQATVKTWESSQATVKTWERSQATVETWGSSQATVETWESSQATVKTWERSQATVKTLGSSQAKLDYSNGGLIQDRDNRKIYIKKSDYKIVLVD